MADICLNHAEHIKKFDQQSLINQDYERRISTLERDVPLNRMESSKDIENINGKLDKIIKTLETGQSRLPNLAWGLGGSVGGGLLVWLILEFLKR